MTFDILTLFPEMFAGPFSESILKRASESGLIRIGLHNIRDYARDRHRTADDAPYGGGAGMVMKVEPLAECLEAVKAERPEAEVILTTPRGEPFSQPLARELARGSGLIFVCGHYEGIDERIRHLYVDREISIGDYVLTGGELAAMVIVDAVARLLPGVLGCGASHLGDSFEESLLEYPQYTRPADFRGQTVPEVLLSGNHAEIERWRRREALRMTRARRPDLLAKATLTEADLRFLRDLEAEGQ